MEQAAKLCSISSEQSSIIRDAFALLSMHNQDAAELEDAKETLDGVVELQRCVIDELFAALTKLIPASELEELDLIYKINSVATAREAVIREKG